MDPLGTHPPHRDRPSAADAGLDAAVRRAVRAATPAPSDALVRRLRTLSPTPAAQPVARPWSIRWAPIFRGIAAVALLAVGIAIGHRWSSPSSRPALPADVVPAAVVAGAEEVHGTCARLAEGLHAGGYPANVAPLAAEVERDLNTSRPYPDLGPIGYRYRGAGPCGGPLADTAHLLYRSVRPGSVNAVSLFVQPWRNQYPLDAGRLYTVSVPTSPFPMLAWRTDRVVYFLLADDAATERAAAELIHGRRDDAPWHGPK